MLRYRRAARAADVVHFQWLPVQQLDARLLPSRSGGAGGYRPLVITAHDVLPREPRPGQRSAQQRLYGRFDAVVVHSEHGRRRLVDELGVAPERVHVIPHGVLRPWEGAREQPLPESLRDAEGPVVLFVGLLRPYKGLDVLLEAWRGIAGAELWIVGMPRMRIEPLLAASPPGVRWHPRFVGDGELLALMRRASLLVLPYREIDQSGVAFTGLGAGLPLLLSDAGGFPELARTGAARIVPASDAPALHAALRELLADPAALAAMAQTRARPPARASCPGAPSRGARSSSTNACARAGARAADGLASPSVAPEVLQDLAVAGVARAEDEDLEPVAARLEGAHDLRRYPHRVERRHVEDLVVEAHAPRPGEDHVDLLRGLVAVSERAAHSRPHHLVGESDRLRVELLAGKVRLAHVREAELRGAVLGLAQVLDRVRHRPRV